MGLDGRVCKLIQEYVNDEKYPPLFQLYVVWYIAFSLAIKIKCDLQVAPARNCQHPSSGAVCNALLGM